MGFSHGGQFRNRSRLCRGTSLTRLSVVIVSNEEQAIREKGEFLSEKYGIEVLPLYRDLAIPGAAKELYDTCQEKNIPIEVLVNNAGMFFLRDLTS